MKYEEILKELEDVLDKMESNDILLDDLMGNYKKAMEPYNAQTYELIALFLLSGLIMIPLILYFASVIVKPIHKLSLESRKIEDRKYDEISFINSNNCFSISLLPQ